MPAAGRGRILHQFRVCAERVGLRAGVNVNRLCAFICAPLINPLNGKTVGPDRTRVRAIARVRSWKETSAKLWIEEDYESAQSGDVVADLHTWKAQRPETVGSLEKDEWFAVIDTIDSGRPLPSRNIANLLERGGKGGGGLPQVP